MQARTRLTSGLSRNVTGGVLGILLATLVAASGQADTLYWGSGSNNITGSQALPAELMYLSGIWNTTLQNWAVDTNGTSYQTWPTTGTSNTAYFGAGLTTDGTNAVITLTENLTANKLDFRDPKGTGNKAITFTAASPVTLTLNGATPTVNLYNAGVNWGVIFPVNVSWAGTVGLNYTGYNGWLQIYGDASQLTGPIAVNISGNGPFLGFYPGSKLGSTDIKVTLGNFILQSANAAANTAFADAAIVSIVGNGGVFSPRAYAGATPSTETIGKVLLTGGFGSIDVQYRSGGSGTNGKFILGDATAGIDRGTYGKGMLSFITSANDLHVTDVVVSNGVATGILPWAMSSYGRLVQLDAADKVLKVAVNTDAPSDVTSWTADQDYRITNVLTGTRNSLTLNSLTAYCSGVSPTLTLGDGQTLTLTRGLLGVQRVGGAVTLTVTNGTITTPASTLHVHLGSVGAIANLYSKIDGTFDLVLGGVNSTLAMLGSSSNTYVGTTYTSVSTLNLAKPTAVAPAIPGDLVVLSGNVSIGDLNAQNQIARTANVTIEEPGSMTGSGNGGTMDFGGNFTINGGIFRGHNNACRHAFDASGTGLRFNGGKLGTVWNAGSGTYLLLTDVSYASTATMPAVFETQYSSTPQLLYLSEGGKGSAVRTFNIANSSTLDAATPEMAIYMNLYEASTTTNAGLTKTGSGTLSVRGMTYYMTGNVTVSNGTLIAAGGWNAVSRSGTTVNGSSNVTLSTTSDLVVGQPISGTGIPSGETIASIDSSTQISLWRMATASGSATMTFPGRPGMAKHHVMSGKQNSGSSIISNLTSTANLVVGQVSGTAGSTGLTIASIDSPTQITLSGNAWMANTSITFLGGSAVGRGPVTVCSGGTLAGEGVADNVTVKSGGILAPGISSDTMSTFKVGGNLTVEAGGTLSVDLTESTNDAVTVYGNVDITGATLAVNGPRPAAGTTFTILSSTNITGSFTTVPDGFKVRVVGNELQLSRQVVGFSFSVQ